MAFSQFLIQQNTLSVTMSSIAPGSRASNLLITKFIDAYNGIVSKCSFTNTENNPWISIMMKSSTPIDKIVLLPPLGGIFSN